MLLHCIIEKDKSSDKYKVVLVYKRLYFWQTTTEKVFENVKDAKDWIKDNIGDNNCVEWSDYDLENFEEENVETETEIKSEPELKEEVININVINKKKYYNGVIARNKNKVKKENKIKRKQQRKELNWRLKRKRKGKKHIGFIKQPRCTNLRPCGPY